MEGDMEWTFSHYITSHQKYYFALCYPWSLDDNNAFLDRTQERCQNSPQIYFHRAVVARTLENRPVDMITISSKSGLTNKDDCFEDGNTLFQGSTKPKVFQSAKRCIIITARVHPGEVPGSHTMTGIIEELTGNSLIAEELRQRFVFYIFPILNPDGVARGHFRVDTKGINLNRCYINPSFKDQPSIYAVKKVLQSIHNQGKYFAFLDIHSQASRKGNFIYGNSSNQLMKQIDSCLFPKILSLNSQNFQYEGSNFMEKHMHMRQKGDHASKEGCGRVAAFYTTKNPSSWTIECSYYMSQTHNVLEPPKMSSEVPAIFDENNLDANLIRQFKECEKFQAQCIFTVDSYRVLGQELCQSLLDFAEANPLSRITKADNYFKSVKNIRMSLALALLKMAPNRFEPQFRKLFFIIDGTDNERMLKRSLSALFLMIVRQARIPMLAEYVKEQDNTVIFPSQSPRNRIIKFNSFKKTSLLSLSKIPPSQRQPSQHHHNRYSSNKLGLEEDFLECDLNQINTSTVFISSLSDKQTDATSYSLVSQTNISANNDSKSQIKNKSKQTVKIIEIDKQIFLKNPPKHEFKMIAITNFEVYPSRSQITNFSNYKKHTKGEERLQANINRNTTYNQMLKLQILPKLLTSSKAKGLSPFARKINQ